MWGSQLIVQHYDLANYSLFLETCTTVAMKIKTLKSENQESVIASSGECWWIINYALLLCLTISYEGICGRKIKTSFPMTVFRFVLFSLCNVSCYYTSSCNRHYTVLNKYIQYHIGHHRKKNRCINRGLSSLLWSFINVFVLWRWGGRQGNTYYFSRIQIQN